MIERNKIATAILNASRQIELSEGFAADALRNADIAQADNDVEAAHSLRFMAVAREAEVRMLRDAMTALVRSLVDRHQGALSLRSGA